MNSVLASVGSDHGWHLVLVAALASVAGAVATLTMLGFVRMRRRAQSGRECANHADLDVLTALPNRLYFEKRIAEVTALAEARGEAAALLYVDLDRLKAINDLFGHAEGDRVLRRVAELLCAVATAETVVTRLGADEFALIQHGVAQPEGARDLAERILAYVAQEMDMARDPTAVGLSIGVALFPTDGRTADRLCANADIALRRAKQSGKGTVRFFDREVDQGVRARRRIEGDLRQAVLGQQLFLEYQPLFDANCNRVVGYEALVRWRHPVHGAISPGVFIPIAEESGSIGQIGEWALAQACAEAANWDPSVYVAVNVSPVQFLRPNLVERIMTTLARTGLDPRRLEIEITEAALIHNGPEVFAALTRLRNLGIRVVMDDFGTGHSSLSNLRLFPFDKIKLDASFTAALESDPASHSIVRAVMALGRSLNLPVVIEGVETERQKQIVLEEGGALIQGFLFGRPGAAPTSAAAPELTLPISA